MDIQYWYNTLLNFFNEMDQMAASCFVAICVFLVVILLCFKKKDRSICVGITNIKSEECIPEFPSGVTNEKNVLPVSCDNNYGKNERHSQPGDTCERKNENVSEPDSIRETAKNIVPENLVTLIEPLGFVIKDIPAGVNNMFEAIADQLLLQNKSGNYTAQIVRQRAEQYLANNVDDARLVMFTARTRDMPQEPKQNDQVLLYAVANSFKRAIEVYHAGKLDASIVRPALALQHNTVHTLCLGFDGRDHYVSLRPFEDENGFEMIDIPSEQRTEDPQDMQEQEESFGEHQTPNSINNETSQIQVILSNGKTIDVNIRTTEQPPVQNGHEFAERLLINIEVDTRTKTPEEVEQYEEDIVSNLKEESGAEELHRIADRHGLEFELAKKECVCLYFKVKDAKLALAFLQKRKIRNEYISNILKFIMNLSSIDGQFPDIVNVSINPQFNVQDTDACPKQYFARKNAFTSSKHVSDDKEDTAMSTVSTGISFAFKRTRSLSTPLRAQGIELSEELANFLQDRGIRDISNMHLEIEHFCFHEAKPCAGDPSEVLQVVGDMVVRIRTMFGPSGTAFRIGTDYLITAKHVLHIASFESSEETDYANVEALFKDEDQPRKVKIIYASGYLDIAILKICEIYQKPLKKLETPVAVTNLEPGQPFYLVGHSSWKKQAVEKTVAIANKFSPNANPTFECFHSEKFGPGSSGSAGVLIVENRVYLANILIGVQLDRDLADKNHVGIKMSAVYQELMKKEPDLCSFLFEDFAREIDARKDRFQSWMHHTSVSNLTTLGRFNG